MKSTTNKRLWRKEQDFLKGMKITVVYFILKAVIKENGTKKGGLEIVVKEELLK